MPSYSYRARNNKGEVITGFIEGLNNEAVAEQLFSKGYIPVKIDEVKKQVSYSFQIFGRVKPEDLIVFSRQLSTLVASGVSFVRSLDTLSEQTKSTKLKEAIIAIRKDVEGGSSFSEALSRFPKLFSPLYISMIKVGEEAGVLDDMLEKIAALLEHEAETRARIKTATRYPKIVVAAIVIAFIILTTLVVPEFAKMYATSKVALPWPTRALIFINKFILKFWPLIVAFVVALYLGFKVYIRTPSGRWYWDKFQLWIPLIGTVVEKSLMSRFARIFATLYRSGIPMLKTLDILSGTIGNVIIERAVEIIKENVREGRGIAKPMVTTGVFPPMVVQMVAVGEETGALDEMLNKVSDYYDLEVEYSIRNLSTTIEPILLILIGGVILFLALAIFLPIWDMINVMRR